MVKKIWWDEGHGGTDPGAVANGLLEKVLNNKIVGYGMAYLENHYIGFEQRSTRGGKDITVELSNRDDGADQWGADVFISCHINAGKGTGFESFIFNGNVDAATVAMQNVLHSEVLAAMRKFGAITDRGKKRANFSVLRETKMKAILTENLFIDSADHKHLKNEAFLKAVGEAHARGAAIYLGLQKKPVSKPPEATDGKLYRVQVGAYKEKANADALEKKLKAAGFDAFVKYE